ncbi:glycine zipper family protein [Vibrio hangzhouensis]|uniref:glycine zipper family protein n=1 Tax=Vibrio hangzhouensis TaxID=462991 RepID=UPI0021BC2A1F|nr:glycine zipper family protein [Vibrio hangzhouensis]
MMKKTLIPLMLTTMFALPAYANLIIDMEGVDEKDYIYDLHKCEQAAAQVQKGQTSGGAVSGAVRGAAIGSAGVAIAGGSGTEGAKKGAAVGLAAGALNRNRSARENNDQYKEDQQTVMRNCMTNRGYVVLN